ncbi:hypothetical protein HMPREF1573_00837 [Gardnerella vaginalis JCP7276]|nr:hypothetical protein HMPREF1575_00656 [Gardnerella vaginalis JCP7672]EPI55524.1 hypothetical protein HMPREF1572_01062 [Gardnerella vaginalis JCP7275]EPI56554.1 hypothetical protein HMPREF1573_00837 [Gardnerella vaginalis JCP7276]
MFAVHIVPHIIVDINVEILTASRHECLSAVLQRQLSLCYS